MLNSIFFSSIICIVREEYYLLIEKYFIFINDWVSNHYYSISISSYRFRPAPPFSLLPYQGLGSSSLFRYRIILSSLLKFRLPFFLLVQNSISSCFSSCTRLQVHSFIQISRFRFMFLLLYPGLCSYVTLPISKFRFMLLFLYPGEG